MLACELERVTLSGWTLRKKASLWADVGDGHCHKLNSAGFGLLLVPSLWNFVQSHTCRLSPMPDGSILL